MATRRWWKNVRRPPAAASAGSWYDFSSDKFGLVSTLARGPLSPIGAIPRGVDPAAHEQVGACHVCGRWDRTTCTRPVNVVICPFDGAGKPVDGRRTRHCWITRAIGSHVPVVHQQLLDALAPDLDGRWLIGDVTFQDGTIVKGLRTVIDTVRAPALRPRFSTRWFRYFGSARLGACAECGRFDHYLNGGLYLLRDEVAHGHPRIMNYSVLVPKRTADRLSFHERAVWPRRDLLRYEAYDEPLDPLPNPMPVWWEEFEQAEAARGVVVPQPNCWIRKSGKSGRWFDRRRKRLGLPVYNIDREVYFLRMLALWHEPTARLIEGKTDTEIEILYLDNRIAVKEGRAKPLL